MSWESINDWSDYREENDGSVTVCADGDAEDARQADKILKEHLNHIFGGAWVRKSEWSSAEGSTITSLWRMQ